MSEEKAIEVKDVMYIRTADANQVEELEAKIVGMNQQLVTTSNCLIDLQETLDDFIELKEQYNSICDDAKRLMKDAYKLM